MPISLPCPNCGAVAKTKREAIGRKAKCRDCGNVFRVEAPESAASKGQSKADRVERSRKSARRTPRPQSVAAAPPPVASRPSSSGQRDTRAARSRSRRSVSPAKLGTAVFVLGLVGATITAGYFAYLFVFGSDERRQASFERLRQHAKHVEPAVIASVDYGPIPLKTFREGAFEFSFYDREAEFERRDEGGSRTPLSASTSRSMRENAVTYVAKRDRVHWQVVVNDFPEFAPPEGFQGGHLIPMVWATAETLTESGYAPGSGPGSFEIDGRPAVAMVHHRQDADRWIYTLFVAARDSVLTYNIEMDEADRTARVGDEVAGSIQVVE